VPCHVAQGDPLHEHVEQHDTLLDIPIRPGVGSCAEDHGQEEEHGYDAQAVQDGRLDAVDVVHSGNLSAVMLHSVDDGPVLYRNFQCVCTMVSYSRASASSMMMRWAQYWLSRMSQFYNQCTLLWKLQEVLLQLGGVTESGQPESSGRVCQTKKRPTHPLPRRAVFPHFSPSSVYTYAP